jgi:hypothetical protein
MSRRLLIALERAKYAWGGFDQSGVEVEYDCPASAVITAMFRRTIFMRN